MLTPWGESVTPDNAWREYPRPQLVREAWLNLNGSWQYAIRDRTRPAPESWDGEIVVPFCVESQLSGVVRRVLPAERLWYRRLFDAPTLERRTLLHFGAVDYHAAVWINSAYAGSHSGGFDPFTLDITEYLRPGGNELVVAVDDPTSASDQPRGKQHLNPNGIWYTPVTGIWQTVWLEQVPLDNHIAEVRVIPDLEGESISVEILLGRPTRDPTLAVQLTVRLDGQFVATRTGRPDRTISLAIAAAKRWSPGAPVLYDVDVALVRVPDPRADDPNGQRAPSRGPHESAAYASAGPAEAVLDTVRTYFGMRSIAVAPHPETEQPTLLLNGAPIFQLATLDQGWWPDGLFTAPSDAAWIHEISYLKAAGFNAVRKHVKVEPDRYYYHCDRLGLLVWQDMPTGFIPAQFVAPNDEGESLRSSLSSGTFERELTAMIRRLRRHPSIIAWVLHNEGWGQFDSERLTALIKSIDPSRPVDAVSGWLDTGAGDFIDRHDYQPEPSAPPPDGRRALIIGECGGLGWPVDGHLWNPEMRNWGYETLGSAEELKAAYARCFAAIERARRESSICAAIYTQTTDVEGEVNGLLTYDRRVEKLPRSWLAELHRSS